MTTNTAVLNKNEKAEEDIFALKQVWNTINAFSCPYQYNFHLHTKCSDGQLTPENLITQALNFGLKGLAITDHHTVDGFLRAKIYLEEISYKKSLDNIPHLWTGIEVTSNLNETKVHILGYGFSPKHPVMRKYLNGDRPLGEEAKAKLVINSIHEAGGLVVLAHPFRYRRSATELIKEAYELGIDGLETYYAYDNPKPWQTSIPQTEVAVEKAQQYNLFRTCGTDTHGSNVLTCQDKIVKRRLNQNPLEL